MSLGSQTGRGGEGRGKGRGGEGAKGKADVSVPLLRLRSFSTNVQCFQGRTKDKLHGVISNEVLALLTRQPCT